MFFVGDINIKVSNYNDVFSWIVKNVIYKNVFEFISENNILFSILFNKYVNLYDKIIYCLKLKYSNLKIFKLYDFVNNIFFYKNINLLIDWINYVKLLLRKIYKLDYGYIRSGILDYLLVGYIVLFE